LGKALAQGIQKKSTPVKGSVLGGRSKSVGGPEWNRQPEKDPPQSGSLLWNEVGERKWSMSSSELTLQKTEIQNKENLRGEGKRTAKKSIDSWTRGPPAPHAPRRTSRPPKKHREGVGGVKN